MCVARMAQPRAQAAVGVINNILFAVGGYNDFSNFGWTSTVEMYQLWPMHICRHNSPSDAVGLILPQC